MGVVCTRKQAYIEVVSIGKRTEHGSNSQWKEVVCVGFTKITIVGGVVGK